VAKMQWIGFDASPFCAAKTLVIAEMLKNGSAVESIVQVWFSSIWRKKTLVEFLEALKSVIRDFYHETQDHIDVEKMSS
jgi:hypothetical protein